VQQHLQSSRRCERWAGLTVGTVSFVTRLLASSLALGILTRVIAGIGLFKLMARSDHSSGGMGD
jgi:hypothetical protein